MEARQVQVTWFIQGPAVKGWQPRRDLGISQVSGLATSGPTFPSSSVLEGRALEDVTQNPCGSLAISLTWHQLCPVPGVTGKVVALWQLEGEGSHGSHRVPSMSVCRINESDHVSWASPSPPVLRELGSVTLATLSRLISP